MNAVVGAMIDWDAYAPGDHRIVCPACGTDPRKRDMGVTVVGEGHGVAHCFKCHCVETRRQQRALTLAEKAVLARRMDALRRRHDAQQQIRRAANAERNAALWAQCVPLSPGDPVARYLARRRLDAGPAPSCLRLHPALPYWHDGSKLGEYPAMVAPLVAPDGRMLALHRTYLTSDGNKADVPTVKKLTGAAAAVAGTCIPLAVPARGVIGIAEGIETAIAAAQASGVPTVAAYCAAAQASWTWPVGVQRLVIFADADRAGREAADTLRARALAAWLGVQVLTPTTENADWADVWAARPEVAE